MIYSFDYFLDKYNVFLRIVKEYDKKRAEPQWFCSSGVIGLASLLSAHYAAVFKVRFGQLQGMVVN